MKDNEFLFTEIVSRIKVIVEAKGESLTSVAIKSGHSKNYFAQLKQLHTPVDLKSLMYIKENFNVSIDSIIYGDNLVKNDNQSLTNAFVRLQNVEEFYQKVLIASLNAALDEYDRVKK